MGTFFEFRGLKLKGGEKLVKFKQDVLLEAAKTGEQISSAHYEIVKGGACIAYTLGWISQQFEVQKNLFHKTQKRPKSIDDRDHIATAAKLVKNFKKYTETGIQNADFMMAADQLADQLGVEILSYDTFSTAGELIEVIKYFAKYEKNMGVKEAASISISLENSNSGHSVGLFRAADRQVHFFDPNVGEYRIKKDSIDLFFQEYVRVLTQTGDKAPFRWKLSPVCWGMRVKRSQ
jgi:hypothetical protein